MNLVNHTTFTRNVDSPFQKPCVKWVITFALSLLIGHVEGTGRIGDSTLDGTTN